VPVELPLLDQRRAMLLTARPAAPFPLLPRSCRAESRERASSTASTSTWPSASAANAASWPANEQNGNPAELNWRRVGEIEGGIYPDAQRWHLSMGCNHCLEPSCLIGCPVEAYSKDSLTGIVDHDPEICIGCQYCV